MKTGSKTTYSPVRQMNRAIQDEFPVMDLRSDSRNHRQQQQQQLELELETEKKFEEVYIYDCCGVSKELNPSIKYMSTFKTLFFLFNFLVFIFGLANFGMGLWFRIDPKVYEIHKYIETQNFTIAGWIMLFCGFTTCLIALLGFASATRQATTLLVVYFTIMIALTLAFVGALVLLTVYGLGATLEHFLTKEIYEQIRRRSMNTDRLPYTSGEAAEFMDFVQVKMRCCGAVDFSDYGKLGMVVPTTCYTIDRNYVLAPGCGQAIRRLFDLRAGLAIGFASGSILSQVLVIVLSAAMFCSIYHWRAKVQRPERVMTSPSRLESPSHMYHQRPRTRTPIII